jgi:hypothetical protein
VDSLAEREMFFAFGMFLREVMAVFSRAFQAHCLALFFEKN